MLSFEHLKCGMTTELNVNFLNLKFVTVTGKLSNMFKYAINWVCESTFSTEQFMKSTGQVFMMKI